MFHRGFENEVAGFARFVLERLRERGLPVLLGQHDRDDSFAWVPWVIEFFSADQALGWGELANHASGSHLNSVRTLPYVAIAAPDLLAGFAHWHRPAGRAEEPALEQFGRGEGIPNKSARSVENAGHDDFAFAAGGYVQSLLHLLSPDDFECGFRAFLLRVCVAFPCISVSRASRRWNRSSQNLR